MKEIDAIHHASAVIQIAHGLQGGMALAEDSFEARIAEIRSKHSLMQLQRRPDMEGISVGAVVGIQYKGQRRRGTIVRESTKRSPRKRGHYWWVVIHNSENLHLCRNARDLKLITLAPPGYDAAKLNAKWKKGAPPDTETYN